MALEEELPKQKFILGDQEFSYEDLIDEIKHWFLYSSYAHIDYEALPRKCQKLEVIETIEDSLSYEDTWHILTEGVAGDYIEEFWSEYEKLTDKIWEKVKDDPKRGFISITWDTPDFVAYAIVIVECVKD